ncbi:RHS repeat domain-containing protein [Streptomyces sp. NPDC058620]|uniref:RHS repeat domain-containing protein n=1 Tax=Streptomyces sp. NPDC058620 TaxID=3346560 RepID=UPI0036624DEB
MWPGPLTQGTQFAYDSSSTLTKITTPDRRVTVFAYDAESRVTSMLRYFFNGADTGLTYTYTYTYTYSDSATASSAVGTTAVTDPEQHATKYVHDDGRLVPGGLDPAGRADALRRCTPSEVAGIPGSSAVRNRVLLSNAGVEAVHDYGSRLARLRHRVVVLPRCDCPVLAFPLVPGLASGAPRRSE